MINLKIIGGTSVQLNGKELCVIIGQRPLKGNVTSGFYLWSRDTKKTFGKKSNGLGGQFAYQADLVSYIKSNEQEIINYFK